MLEYLLAILLTELTLVLLLLFFSEMLLFRNLQYISWAYQRLDETLKRVFVKVMPPELQKSVLHDLLAPHDLESNFFYSKEARILFTSAISD